MSEFLNNAIFWVEVEKIKPNPYQPRKEFNEEHLRDLSDSIRQYGILQPLVVTRNEIATPEGGMVVEYELIAGERRLRASRAISCGIVAPGKKSTSRIFRFEALCSPASLYIT